MQVHIPTWGRYITVEESHEVRRNIQKGTSILYKYFRQTNENLIRALYRYYGAPDPSYAKRVLRAAVNFKRFYKKNIDHSP
jgi:soluble lytic murein transglycosylase-like protein